MKKIYIIIISGVIAIMMFFLGFYIKSSRPESVREIVLILENKSMVKLTKIEDIDYIENILLSSIKYDAEKTFNPEFINKASLIINNPYSESLLFQGTVYTYKDYSIIEVNYGYNRNFIELDRNESNFFKVLISY